MAPRARPASRWWPGDDGARRRQPSDVVVEAFGCELPDRCRRRSWRAARRRRSGSTSSTSAPSLTSSASHGLPSPQFSGRRRTGLTKLVLLSRLQRTAPAACCASRACSSAGRPSATARLAARASASPARARRALRQPVLLSQTRRLGACSTRCRRAPTLLLADRRAPRADRARRASARRCAAARCARSLCRCCRRPTSTACSGPATSTSCAAKTRWCARSGRARRSSGRSIRSTTARTRAKLEAFLDLFLAEAPRRAGARVRACSRAWNGLADRRRAGARRTDAGRMGGALPLRWRDRLAARSPT